MHPVRTGRIHMTTPTCCRTCLSIIGEKTIMVDPNEHELAAMGAASDRAGEYIEALRKTDMAKRSQAEWGAFIEAVCGGYVDALVARQAAAMEALARAQTMP